MSRWFIKSTINDGNRCHPGSNESYEESYKQSEEIEPNRFEKEENEWEKNFNENRNTNGVIGVDKDGKGPFITIFDGHK